jgi:MFS family permease
MLMAATSVTTMVFGPISGWFSDRFGRVWFAAAGAAAATLSFMLMLGFDLESSASTIAPVFILLGVGAGMFQPANNSIIMGAVDRENLGTAFALIAAHRQVGIALGMAVTGTFFSSWKDRYDAGLVLEGFDRTEETDPNLGRPEWRQLEENKEVAIARTTTMTLRLSISRD